MFSSFLQDVIQYFVIAVTFEMVVCGMCLSGLLRVNRGHSQTKIPSGTPYLDPPLDPTHHATCIALKILSFSSTPSWHSGEVLH